VDRPNGSPWRDLPPSFGHWNSVFTRFRDWGEGGISGSGCLTPCPTIPTWNTPWSDATIVKVHRHGQGAKGGLKARRSAVRRAA